MVRKHEGAPVQTGSPCLEVKSFQAKLVQSRRIGGGHWTKRSLSGEKPKTQEWMPVMLGTSCFEASWNHSQTTIRLRESDPAIKLRRHPRLTTEKKCGAWF